jgi:glycosyltransferase involved in cell wall biosynthesis
MKTLFISNYRDNTGWAHAAQSYILAMDTAGLDVVPRCIKLNNTQGEVPQRILDLEKKSDKKCDIVIQNVLPHMMSYSGKFDKNIGLCYVETSSFTDSSWPQYLNMMDEVWVPSTYNVTACENSFVNKPIRNVPIAVDKNKFVKGYQPLNIPETDHRFTFYFIGENTKRKNLATLLQAFHTEFRVTEPVHLVIKTSQPGSQNPEKDIQEFIKRVKVSLKLYKNPSDYKAETLVLGQLSEEDMCQLHATGDCLVVPSYGESWNIPCQEAMLFGNTPIYTSGLGMDDYCDPSMGIGSHSIPAMETLDTFPDLCTARETWRQPNLSGLRKIMREIYEDKKFRENVSQNDMNELDNHSYEVVGNKIKNLLERN